MMCLAYFSLHVIHECVYMRKKALADVRPTAAGIKCLYCKTSHSSYENVTIVLDYATMIIVRLIIYRLERGDSFE